MIYSPIVSFFFLEMESIMLKRKTNYGLKYDLLALVEVKNFYVKNELVVSLGKT